MKVKEEGKKTGLKLNIQKTKIMASGPITSWQIDGETVETVTDFILGGSKITADGACHESKRCLPLGRKAMTKRDSILKNRNFTLPTNVHLVKAMVFPVVMYGDESWTIEKAERWRIDDLNYGFGEDSWESLGLLEKPLDHSNDLNQIPYDYTVEVTNRFKGLDLIDRVPEELWTEICDTAQEAVIKTIPPKKEM